MTLDGFLTFLTLIIAAYSVAPSATRLRLGLRPLTLSFGSIVAFLLVMYYEMFAKKYSLSCPSQLGSLCKYLVLDDTNFPTPGEISFLIVILWLSAAWIIIRRRGISAGGLPSLRRLVDELSYERRYAELIKVVEPILPLLATAAARNTRSAKLYDHLRLWRHRGVPVETPTRRALNEVQYAPNLRQNLLKTFKFSIGTAGSILPDGGRKQQAAKDVLRVLLLGQDMIQFIALYRAAFGVKLLGLDVNEIHPFSEEYLMALISTPRSTLYAEVKNNQNYRGGATQYVFPEENKLLHFLFADARQAERLGVWKPLGEWIIARLRPERYASYTSSLNLPSDSFEDECWDDPAFVVIQFFDLMVSAAEYQDVSWHMWLYYYPHILNRLLAIYSDNEPGVDPNAERPTRAAYIIYAMFSAMRDWITAVSDLPVTSSQLTLENERVDHENNNIPKSAILALGMCLRDLLLAEKVGARFKQTIISLVLSGIARLERDGPLGAFRRVLIASIVQGGPSGSDNNEAYIQQIAMGYRAANYSTKSRLDDLALALQDLPSVRF